MNGKEPPAPVAVQQTTFIQVGSEKSVVGAVLLGFFFGPLGMLYSTVVGALVMFAINILVAIATLGLGLLITLPICAIWAGFAADGHNKKLRGIATHTAATGAQFGSPAAWHTDPEGSGRLRYYDGSSWTDYYSDQPGPAAPAATAEPDVETEAAETKQLAAGSERESVVGAPPTEVFCGACGEGVSAEAKFCSACGETQAVA